MDTPDAIALVRILGALFGGEVLDRREVLELAMREGMRGDGQDLHLMSEVGELRVGWRTDDATTTEVVVLGEPGAIGLIDAVFDPEDATVTSEALYRYGTELWSGRRLEPALRALTEAAVVAEDDPLQVWAAAIDRALAQIALELDRPDLAEEHLAAFQPHPVAAFQHLAVESRLRLLRGDPEGAAERASTGVAMVLGVNLEEVADLMNASIGLAHVAEVLLELGFAASAGRLAALGQSLVLQAGVTDPVVSAMLALCAARAAGLSGDAVAGERLLAEVDTDLDADLDVQVRAERARILWRTGEVDAGRAALDDAIERALAVDLRAIARLLTAERDADKPRAPRDEPGPIETWFGAEPSDERPYAVVVSLVVQGSLDRYADLEDEVVELLDRQPGLGAVDGVGTDGTVWDLFLDGDDAVALWAAIAPLVAAMDPPPGSSVRIRAADGDVVERSLQP